MAYRESLPVNAGADLSTFQYRAVAVGGTLAASGAACIGILQNKPKSGEDGTACYLGRSRYIAGAAVTAGARLQVQSGGWLIAAASGDNVETVATAIGAVSSGGIGEAIVNFANPALY